LLPTRGVRGPGFGPGGLGPCGFGGTTWLPPSPAGLAAAAGFAGSGVTSGVTSGVAGSSGAAGSSLARAGLGGAGFFAAGALGRAAAFLA